MIELKICTLTSSFPRYKGDMSGIFIYHLSKSLIDKGVEVEIICPHFFGYPKFEIMDGIKIHRFTYFIPEKYQKLAYGHGILKNIHTDIISILQLPFFLLASLLYTLWKIKKLKPDIIHSHWMIPQGLIGIICRRILKVPCVTTVHGSDIFGLNEQWIDKFKAEVIKWSDKCTVNSQRAKNKVMELICREDIKTIPMGVDTEIFKRTSDVIELRRLYGKNTKIILYVGRFIDLKGVEYLIKSIPDVRNNIPDIKVLLIGEGPNKKSYMNLIQELNLVECFHFINPLPQEKLIKYYSYSDLLVLPSIVNDSGESEGLGVVLLEALSCHCPVIGTDTGGISEIITNGKTGLIAEPKNAVSLAEKIEILLKDNKTRKMTIENGYKMIQKKFTWNVITDRFINVYESILDENR